MLYRSCVGWSILGIVSAMSLNIFAIHRIVMDSVKRAREVAAASTPSTTATTTGSTTGSSAWWWEADIVPGTVLTFGELGNVVTRSYVVLFCVLVLLLEGDVRWVAYNFRLLTRPSSASSSTPSWASSARAAGRPNDAAGQHLLLVLLSAAALPCADTCFSGAKRTRCGRRGETHSATDYDDPEVKQRRRAARRDANWRPRRASSSCRSSGSSSSSSTSRSWYSHREGGEATR